MVLALQGDNMKFLRCSDGSYINVACIRKLFIRIVTGKNPAQVCAQLESNSERDFEWVVVNLFDDVKKAEKHLETLVDRLS